MPAWAGRTIVARSAHAARIFAGIKKPRSRAGFFTFG
jgi:hypothetical protein